MVKSNIVIRKKDRLALLVISGELLEDIIAWLDISIIAKETWEFLKTRHMGATCTVKAREEELAIDFAGQLSKVARNLRSFEE